MIVLLAKVGPNGTYLHDFTCIWLLCNYFDSCIKTCVFSEAMLHHATLFLARLALTRTCWEFPWLGSSPQLFERSARNGKMQGNPLILQQEWRLQNSSKRNRHNSTRTIPQCQIMEWERRHARVHTHLYCKPKRAQVQTPKTPMCQKCLRAMTCHDSWYITIFAEIRSWSLWSCLTLLALRGSPWQSLHRITPRLRAVTSRRPPVMSRVMFAFPPRISANQIWQWVIPFKMEVLMENHRWW